MSCERCGGFKIAEYFYGADSSCGFWSYQGLRCVNCGAISVEPEKKPAMPVVDERVVAPAEPQIVA